MNSKPYAVTPLRFPAVVGTLCALLSVVSCQSEELITSSSNVSAPTALTTSSITKSEVTLGWTDVATNETGYEVQKCAGSNCTNFTVSTSSLAADTTSYRQSGLSANTTYRFRVRAKNTTASSAWLTSEDVKTAAGPPSTPTSMSQTIATNYITLSWSDSTGEDSYTIQYCTGSNCDFSTYTEAAAIAANTVSKQFTSLTEGTVYRFRIKAVNGVGASDWLTSGNLTTLTTPGAPAAFSVAAKNATAAVLQWNKVADVTYSVQRCNPNADCTSTDGCADVTTSYTPSANPATYSVSGLTAATQYRFRVRASVLGGDGAWSCATDTTRALPGAPAMGATAKDKSPDTITVQWTYNWGADDAGIATRGAEIEYCNNASCSYATATGSPVADPTAELSVTGLTEGTAYKFRVRSYRTISGTTDNSAWSELAAVTAAGLTAPTGFTVREVGDTQINFSWIDNDATEDGYDVIKCDLTADADCTYSSSSVVVDATAPANKSVYSATGLTSGHSYNFWIRARKAGPPIVYSTLLASSSSVTTKAQVLPWVTNGPVKAMVQSGNTLYLGGDFTRVGPNVSYGAFLSQSSNYVDPVFAENRVNGPVYAAISDGAGGYYIGGLFSKVGSWTRNNIAHIQSTGEVDPVWNPNANGAVRALALNGSMLYVGGAFTNIGGQARVSLAGLSTATGNATMPAFDTGGGEIVYALQVSSSTLYVGGNFTAINATARQGLAAVNISTNTLSTWDPGQAGAVIYAIGAYGSYVYVGGSFASMGTNALARTNLAKISISTGATDTWNASISGGVVRTLLVNSGMLFVGGDFTGASSTTVYGLTSYNLSTGYITALKPQFNVANVQSLALSSSTLYVGGGFTAIGSTGRNYLAAVDANSGSVSSWNPYVDDEVNALVVSGTNVYIGGDFTMIGSYARNGLAAIEADSGELTSFDPNANGAVNALALHETTLYAGGAFTSMGGATRTYLGAIDTATGAATSWDPSNLDGAVNALLIHNNKLYAGGAFQIADSTSRKRLAAFSLSGGTLDTTWAPVVEDGVVNALAVDDLTSATPKIYVGGTFTLVTKGGASTSRNHLASINVSDGTFTTWDPNLNGDVNALVGTAAAIYVGGNFTAFGSGTCSYVAKVLVADATTTACPTAPNAAVYSLALNGTILYYGGSFTTVGGAAAHSSLAAYDFAGAGTFQDSWETTVTGGPVRSLLVSDKALYFGGDFSSVLSGGAATAVPRLGAYNITTPNAAATLLSFP